MKTVQLVKHSDNDWEYLSDKLELKAPLVLALGNRFMLEEKGIHEELRQKFPDGHIVFGSTSGDITAEYVSDQSITVTAIEFEKTAFQIETSNLLTSDVDKISSVIPFLATIAAASLKLTPPLQDTFKGYNSIRGGLPDLEETMKLIELNENSSLKTQKEDREAIL